METFDKVSGEPSMAKSPQFLNKVYFVRHGKTEWNDSMRFQGHTDIPLCDEGRGQSYRTACRVKNIQVKRVISSPLVRATQTAQIIANEIGNCDIDIWPELEEENFGDWEGLTIPQIKGKYGTEEFGKWEKDHVYYSVPGGENWQHLYERSLAAATKILGLRDGKTIVVGHGAMFRVLFTAIIGLPLSDAFWHMRLDNCSISAVGINKYKKSAMLFLNDTVHLQDTENSGVTLPIV